MKPNLTHFSLQFITHYTDTISYLDSVRIALDGGCRWVQLRMKEAPVAEIEPVAIRAKQLCQEYGATFLIDDHVELVARVGADGVHLGKNDMPVDEARRMLGPEFIIGGTANTLADVQRLYHQGADYVGCGPFRFTTTKKNLSPVLGFEGYRSILTQMQALGIDLPLVAIGGIASTDIPELLQLGIQGIALSGSVLRAANPVAEMHRVVTLSHGG